MAASLPFEFRRVRDFGQLLSGLVEFLRGHWKNLGKSLIFIAGPLLLILGVAGGGLVNEIFSMMGTVYAQQSMGNPPDANQFLLIGVELLILMVVYFLAGASVLAVTNEYILMSIGDEMENFSVSLLWGNVSSRFWSHLANFIVINSYALVIILPVFFFGMVVGMGGLGAEEMIVVLYLMLFFGGLPVIVYFGTVISLYPAIRLQENRGIFAAIKRSFYLIKGNFWISLGFYIVTGIVQSVIGSVFVIPFYVFYFIAIITIMPESGMSPDGVPNFGIAFQIGITVSGVIAVGSGLLLNAISVTAHTLQYFNLVERKEGVGMMAKLDLLGVQQNGQGGQDDHTEEY